jgi:hypothetical protein
MVNIERRWKYNFSSSILPTLEAPHLQVVKRASESEALPTDVDVSPNEVIGTD